MAKTTKEEVDRLLELDETVKTFIKSDAEHEVFCAVANRLVLMDPAPESDEGKALDFLARVIEEYQGSEHGRNVPKWLEE